MLPTPNQKSSKDSGGTSGNNPSQGHLSNAYPTDARRSSTSSLSNNDTTNQIAFLQHRILDMTSMISKERAVHSRELDFIRNLLYTLYHSRGFLTITDQYGTTVDLSQCHGDYLYDLRVREDFTQIRTRIKKVWGNEHYYKALLGNQERTIQYLSRELEHKKDGVLEDQNDEITGNTKKKLDSGESSQTEESKSSEESGIKEIITLMETTCQHYPQVYYALREQHKVNANARERKLNKSKSQRIMEILSPESSSGHYEDILEKILDRCKSRVDTSHEDPENCNPSLIPSPKGSLTSPTGKDHKTNPNLCPNGARATTPPPQDSRTKSCFEILDFEKFIGAAVLHVKGKETENQNTNISPEKSSSISPRNGKSGKIAIKEEMTVAGASNIDSCTHTKRKKSRKIIKNSKSGKKLEQERDAGDNTFLQISPALLPLPTLVAGTNMTNRAGRSRSGSPAGPNINNATSLLTLPTGSSSASSGLDSAQRQLSSTLALAKASSQSQFGLRTNSSFPSQDNRSQSLLPISPILLASSSLKFKNPPSRQITRSRSLSQEKFGVGVGKGKLSDNQVPRRPLSPSPLSWSKFGVGVGPRGNLVDVGLLTQRKQKVGGGGRPSFQESPVERAVTPPQMRKLINSIRPKTSEHVSSRRNDGLPSSASTPEFTRAGIGMSCPYCCQDFDKNMSPDDVRKHLEKHVLPQKAT